MVQTWHSRSQPDPRRLGVLRLLRRSAWGQSGTGLNWSGLNCNTSAKQQPAWCFTVSLPRSDMTVPKSYPLKGSLKGINRAESTRSKEEILQAKKPRLSSMKEVRVRETRPVRSDEDSNSCSRLFADSSRPRVAPSEQQAQHVAISPLRQPAGERVPLGEVLSRSPLVFFPPALRTVCIYSEGLEGVHSNSCTCSTFFLWGIGGNLVYWQLFQQAHHHRLGMVSYLLSRCLYWLGFLCGIGVLFFIALASVSGGPCLLNQPWMAWASLCYCFASYF